MRNRTYGGVRGRKTKVGEKLLRFPPTRLFCYFLVSVATSENAEQIKEEVDEIEIQGECTE